jgi:hypothetical protein
VMVNKGLGWSLCYSYISGIAMALVSRLAVKM